MVTHIEEVFTADKQKLLGNKAKDIFSELIQNDQLVGDIYSISFEEAVVIIHDVHRQKVGGIPSLCFLLATRVQSDSPVDFTKEDASVILLRVLDSAPLPDDGEVARLRVEAAKRVSGTKSHWDEGEAMDPLTANELSYAGMRCRVIGTFHLTESAAKTNGQPTLDLRFGSDLSNFYPNQGLKVYKPNESALKKIVNYRDPERYQQEVSSEMVEVGNVRYASTNRDYQGIGDVPVSVMPADLLSQKTALFGMTRTGKSNTTKIILKSVFDLRYNAKTPLKIGQLVFDVNGEYANENTQDAGKRAAAAIKNLRDAHPKAVEADVVTYGITTHPADSGRTMMRLNFYEEQNLQTGKTEIDESLRQYSSYTFVNNFRQVKFEVPDPTDRSATTRYQRHVLCYRALLNKAGFPPPATLPPVTSGLFSKELIEALEKSTGADKTKHLQAASFLKSSSLSWSQMAQACDYLYDFIMDKKSGYEAFETWYMTVKPKASGDAWADDNLKKILAMFSQPNGSRRMGEVAFKHTNSTTGDYAEAIYEDLVAGKLVLVDQSSGDELSNRQSASRVMDVIFKANQEIFRNGKFPPDILVYVEEAHNLLPAQSTNTDFSDIWIKTAKEGGKYHLGLVYATQEVSSIQRNILKNTANFFIGHLNNTDETRELCKYYDFDDFDRSIRRAQDKGFLRVKTLSNPFIVPTQIKKFEV